MFVRSFVAAAAAVVLAGGAAQAADLIVPSTPVPIYEAGGFSWEGLYVGVRGGLSTYGDNGAAQVGFGQVGGAVGVNFIPADPILLGLEVTGDYYWNNATSGSAFYANLKGGVVVTDQALIYAIAGIGVDTAAGVSVAMYQVGGGVEFAVTDAVTIRGEAVAQGDFTGGAGDNLIEGATATVGVFYHF